MGKEWGRTRKGREEEEEPSQAPRGQGKGAGKEQVPCLGGMGTGVVKERRKRGRRIEFRGEKGK